MATIQQNIQSIRSAVYGREVRTAIADSISQCYDNVSTSTTLADAAAVRATNAAENAENSVKEIDGVYDGAIAFDSGAKNYYNLQAKGVGDVLDINNPAGGNDTHYKIIIRDLKVGETFTVSLTNGPTARPYVIVDSNDVILEKASGQTKNGTITIPENGSTIVFQVRDPNTCYVVRDLNMYSIDDRIKTVKDEAATVSNDLNRNIPLAQSIGVHYNYTLLSMDFEEGTWSYATKAPISGSMKKRIRSKALFAVTPNTVISYSVSEDYKIYVGVVPTTLENRSLANTSWTTGSGSLVLFNKTSEFGYAYFIVERADTTPIELSEASNLYFNVNTHESPYEILTGMEKPIWTKYKENNLDRYHTADLFGFNGKDICLKTIPGVYVTIGAYGSDGSLVKYIPFGRDPIRTATIDQDVYSIRLIVYNYKPESTDSSVTEDHLKNTIICLKNSMMYTLML